MDAKQREIAKGLFKLAWADGEVQQNEVDLVAGLLEQMGFPLIDRLSLMDEALSENRREEPQLDDVVLLREDRLEAVGMFVRLCFADGRANPQEMAILGELAMRWGITADELEHLRQGGPR